ASSGKHAVCLAGVPVGALADLATGGKKSAFLATGSKIEQPGGRPMHLFGLPPDTETSANPGPWEHGAHRAMFGPAPGAPGEALTGLSGSVRDTLARCRRGRSRFAALLRAW